MVTPSFVLCVSLHMSFLRIYVYIYFYLIIEVEHRKKPITIIFTTPQHKSVDIRIHSYFILCLLLFYAQSLKNVIKRPGKFWLEGLTTRRSYDSITTGRNSSELSKEVTQNVYVKRHCTVPYFLQPFRDDSVRQDYEKKVPF